MIAVVTAVAAPLPAPAKAATRGTSVEMTVNEIGPSLRFATAKVTRANRSGGGGGGFGGGGNSGGGFNGGNSGGGAPAPANDHWSSQPSQGGSGSWGGNSGASEEPPF